MARKKRKAKKAVKESIVLEYYGKSLGLDDAVLEALKELKPGGHLFLTVPYSMVLRASYPAIHSRLSKLASEVAPLNVSGNPNLKDTDVSQRIGFICHK